MGPRVLVVLDTAAAWSRGILRGFADVAHANGWTLLHYHPESKLEWLLKEFSPAVLVVGPALTVPLRDGRTALGTWQGVYLCEHRDRGGPRSIVVTLWGEAG